MGTLSQTVLDVANPEKLKGIDRSESLVDSWQNRVTDSLAQFEVGKAKALPGESESCDAAVSGLVLNLVPRVIPELTRASPAG